jgi:hypothetical protein
VGVGKMYNAISKILLMMALSPILILNVEASSSPTLYRSIEVMYPVAGASMGNTGDYVAVESMGDFQLNIIRTEDATSVIEFPVKFSREMLFSSDDSVLVVMEEETLSIVDIEMGERVIVSEKPYIYNFNPDTGWLAYQEEGSDDIVILDVVENTVLSTLSKPDVIALGFTLDQQALIIVEQSGSVINARLCEDNSYCEEETIIQFQPLDDITVSLNISPDSNYLFIGLSSINKYNLVVWNLRDSEEVDVSDRQIFSATHLYSRLWVWGDPLIDSIWTVWDVVENEDIAPLPQGIISSNLDSTRLVFTTQDNGELAIVIMEVSTEEILGQIDIEYGIVRDLDFYGRYLLTYPVSFDNTTVQTQLDIWLMP